MNLPPQAIRGKMPRQTGWIVHGADFRSLSQRIVLFGGVISSEKSHTKVLTAPLFLVTVLVTVRSRFWARLAICAHQPLSQRLKVKSLNS